MRVAMIVREKGERAEQYVQLSLRECVRKSSHLRCVQMRPHHVVRT